jgi:hypothetical protein
MTGWRKRQVMELARESWLDVYGFGHDRESFIKALEAFAELVREDEREARAKACEDAPEPDGKDLAERIRARGQA